MALGAKIDAPPDLVKCGARTRNGGTCGQLPIRGRTRCRIHGGKSTGPRPRNRLYTQHLTPEQRADYDATDARGPLGRIDDGIALASAQLAAYLREFGLKILGGQIVRESTGDNITSYSHELHVSVVLKHIDALRRLEHSRAKVQLALGGGASEHGDVDQWLEGLAGKPSGP